MKALKKVVRGVTLAELWATALTFVIMVVCYFISVVNRNFIKGSMPWTEDKHHVLIVFFCKATEVSIGKVNAWSTAPVSKEPALDVIKRYLTLHEVVIC